MEAGDWRPLQADSRRRIVIKIIETLKRHLPYSTPEGLQELESVALRFEEKIYTEATSQSDYLRKISVKMMKMEKKPDSNNWQVPQARIKIPGQVMGVQAQVQILDQVTGVEAAQGMEAGDWRTPLRADSRQRIINKIADTLKRHLPFSGAEGLLEIQRIAIKFEEKIYTESKSQSEYLRKISSNMLTMETRQQNHMASSSENPGSVITESPDSPRNILVAFGLLQIDAPEVIDIDYSDQEEIDSDESNTKLLMLFH